MYPEEYSMSSLFASTTCVQELIRMARVDLLFCEMLITLPESSSYRCNFSHVADNIFTRLRPRRFSVQILENILLDHQESKCITRRTHFGFLCSVFIVSSFSLSASSFPYKLRENSGCFFILVDPHVKPFCNGNIGFQGKI